jgi:phospholipid-binding lipoprotein MlaA
MMKRRAIEIARVAAFTLALGAGGASLAQSEAKPNKDPLEGWNRAVFGFNEAVDRAVLVPLAKGYQAVVPELVRTGVTNVFANFGDGWSAINQALQGKGEAASTMTMRVVTNTLFGIGGLFDVASDLGMERQSEDFGQTLGRWGFGPGPYFVWPLLGPSTIRDTVARPLDLAWSPTRLTHDDPTRYAITGLQLIDTRANLLGATRVLDDIALDKYTFVRDAYLARRRNLVYDGDPPEEPQDTGPATAPPAAPK